MLEGGGCSHTEGLAQLPDQLPGVQSIAEVDEAGGTVDHWEDAAPVTTLGFSKS